MDEIIKKANNKEKLSLEEQVLYMKYKGITFEYETEDKALEILESNSYYYKLTAYRKNFSKDDQGKYIDLDFKHLSDLAIIDMHLRYFIMKLTLDIEHSIKTKLIKSITESSIDSKEIIEQYDAFQRKSFESRINNSSRLTTEEKQNKTKQYTPVIQNIMGDYSNPKDYAYDLYSKQIDNPSIWALIELMSFGQLASFVKFYNGENLFNANTFTEASIFLKYSQNIRNCAAHSRPLLLYLDQTFQFRDKSRNRRYPNIRLKNFVIKNGVPIKVANIRLTNMRLHDIAATLYLHNYYVESEGIQFNRSKEFSDLLERFRRHSQLYEKHSHLIEIYHLFSALEQSK